MERSFRLIVYGATVPFVNGILLGAGGESTTATKAQDNLYSLDHLLRPLRADARRNRAKAPRMASTSSGRAVPLPPIRRRVLEAADEVFASEGLTVPIDEVARRAGVGVGTIYRHFPTKQALFEAIVLARIEALVQEGEALCAAEDPGAALFTFISELVDLAVKKRDLSDELARAGVESEQLVGGVKERLERCFDVLLERAQDSGGATGHQPDRCHRLGHGYLYGRQPTWVQ